jgi:hypothetical protein
METASSYQGTLASWVSEMECFKLGRQRTGSDGSALPDRGNGQLRHRAQLASGVIRCGNGIFEALLVVTEGARTRR